MKELLVVKSNIDRLLGKDREEERKETFINRT
jgi:hypothetical protein